LRSLPYPEADQLTLVWRRNTKGGDDSYLTSGNYLDLLRQNQSFAQMAVISDHDFSLNGVCRVGVIDDVTERFYAVSLERELRPPAVIAVNEAARRKLFH
jgi:hypothetical protein